MSLSCILHCNVLHHIIFLPVWTGKYGSCSGFFVVVLFCFCFFCKHQVLYFLPATGHDLQMLAKGWPMSLYKAPSILFYVFCNVRCTLMVLYKYDNDDDDGWGLVPILRSDPIALHCLDSCIPGSRGGKIRACQVPILLLGICMREGAASPPLLIHHFQATLSPRWGGGNPPRPPLFLPGGVRQA